TLRGRRRPEDRVRPPALLDLQRRQAAPRRLSRNSGASSSGRGREYLRDPYLLGVDSDAVRTELSQRVKASVVEKGTPGPGRSYLIATALTCRKSVRPWSDFNTPSWTSVVPSAFACVSISATRALVWMSRFISSLPTRSSWMAARPR